MDAITIDEIARRWIPGSRGHAANVEMWDSQADGEGYLTVPSLQTDAFLRLLEEAGALRNDIDILDVGCGAGVYSMALSSVANQAVGIDISSRMIENGIRLVKARDIANVRLVCSDWSKVDIAESMMEGTFDLTFAHNTPAISSLSAFEKLNRCSRGFCAVSMPTSMDEPVLNELREELGGKETFDRMCNMLFMVDYLLLKGIRPTIAFEDAVWPVDQPIDSAIPYYAGKLWEPGDDREDLKHRIRELLAKRVRNGHIEDTIHAVTTMMVWRVRT